MYPVEMISLPCPCCRGDIRRPLEWFAQTYTTCPLCGLGVAATQFAPLLRDLEDAIEACAEEMLGEKNSCSCRCGKTDV